jgi:eukaryotic-like serine/threonine-protein kinase
MRQLHSRNVAHQDIKPSNTLVFAADTSGRRVTKVGDLGRATVLGVPMAHDEYDVAGDPTYCPPEALYHAIPEGFGPRRIACDLYQLGSMIAFVFAAVPMNALLKMELHPAHSWENWGGTYAEVMPYVRDALARSVDHVAARVPMPIRESLSALLAQLCEPDPFYRGHKKTSTSANPYALDRVVTQLDLLSRRAEAAVRLVS